ncbi:hypothetical protein E2C01_090892 [Portunus trituberculatus]|uniref:Uncharacterized protein n=1 Tax=Portunus trituberculatus TaxID=210409 RepID=A0A5B7JHU7_PORTR|nr:hypothetical protein [Portunus trituberculatus]
MLPFAAEATCPPEETCNEVLPTEWSTWARSLMETRGSGGSSRGRAYCSEAGRG